MPPPKRLPRLVPLVLVLMGVPLPIAAQNGNIAPSTPSTDTSSNTSLGWILTPAIAVSTAWDDNVFVQGAGDEGTGDVVNTVNPRLGAAFNGRGTAVNINYSGAFLLYRDLSSLDSYDQRASVSARRRLSRNVTWFVDNAFAIVPTTELTALVGVPFVRTGSKLDDLQTGVEANVTKLTTIAVAGNLQWVVFDQNPTFVTQLYGGHGVGADASLRHRLSETTALLTDYRVQYALISQTGETFAVQTIEGGFEHRFSEWVTAFAEVGIARLNATVAGEERTGPSIRAGLSRHAGRAGLQVNYSRTFVPSYGFGGTTQNEELIGSGTIPFAQRFYAQAAAAVRRNEALEAGVPDLRSFWFEASIGYDWGVAQIEGFYGGAHQVIDRPGGIVNRNRFGVQLVTSKRVRVH